MDDLQAAFDSYSQKADGTTPPTPTPETTPAAEAKPDDASKGADADVKPKADATPPAAPAKTEATPPPASTPEPKDEERMLPLNRHKEILHSTRTSYEGQISELKQALEKAQVAPTPKNLESLQALKEKLKDEAPEFVIDIVDALERELVVRDEKLAKYEERERQNAEAEVAVAETRRSELLNQIPTLKEWEAAAKAEDATPEAKALWNRAVIEERDLRASGLERWTDPKVRFERAMERAADVFGVEIPKPAAAAPAADTKATTPRAAPKPLPPASTPTSLSQIPSGQPPPPPSPGFQGSFVQGLAATRGMTDAQSEAYWLGAER